MCKITEEMRKAHNVVSCKNNNNNKKNTKTFLSSWEIIIFPLYLLRSRSLGVFWTFWRAERGENVSRASCSPPPSCNRFCGSVLLCGSLWRTTHCEIYNLTPLDSTVSSSWLTSAWANPRPLIVNKARRRSLSWDTTSIQGLVLVDIKCFYYYGYRGKKFELTFYGVELSLFFFVCFFKHIIRGNRQRLHVMQTR